MPRPSSLAWPAISSRLATGKALTIAEFNPSRVTVWRVRPDCAVRRGSGASRMTWTRSASGMLDERRAVRPSSGPARRPHYARPHRPRYGRGGQDGSTPIARSMSPGRPTPVPGRSARPTRSMTCSRRPPRACRCPRPCGTSSCCCAAPVGPAGVHRPAVVPARGPARRFQAVHGPLRAERRQRHRIRRGGARCGLRVPARLHESARSRPAPTRSPRRCYAPAWSASTGCRSSCARTRGAWLDVLAEVPDRLDVTGPSHLIVAIEVVRHRRDVRDQDRPRRRAHPRAAADAADGPVTFSLLTYGAHTL